MAHEDNIIKIHIHQIATNTGTKIIVNNPLFWIHQSEYVTACTWTLNRKGFSGELDIPNTSISEDVSWWSSN